jgi:uncharacterized membrane protein YqaE (UPF0057 family)
MEHEHLRSMREALPERPAELDHQFSGVGYRLRYDVYRPVGHGEGTVRYLFAVVLPPLAVLLCGRPFQALLSLPLTLLGWFPGVIHALFVVHNYYADQRNEKLIREMRKTRG